MQQVRQFISFLGHCRDQNMIGRCEGCEQRNGVIRFHTDFVIDKDFSRTVALGETVLKGTFSDEVDYDKLSEYSADSSTET